MIILSRRNSNYIAEMTKNGLSDLYVEKMMRKRLASITIKTSLYTGRFSNFKGAATDYENLYPANHLVPKWPGCANGARENCHQPEAISFIEDLQNTC